MDLKKTRHHLHQYPEVSGQEQNTQAYIVKKLQAIGVEKIHKNFFETAVLAEIGPEKPEKTLLFRCELDALPIAETNHNLAYKSKNEGIAHKCGHDGHMTILLGVAEKLMQKNPSKGKVLLLFQPAEENGRGARGILASKKLEEFAIDFIFALHNVPRYPLGSIICKAGSFTPSVESLEVKLTGRTSHAGMPETGINPATAIAELIRYYHSLHQPDTEQEEYFLASPIQIIMGELAYGTTAGDGLISYTFRSYDHDFFIAQKENIAKRVAQIAHKTKGLHYQLAWKEGFEANINHEKAYTFIKEAATQNKLRYIEKPIGFSWGEDFGRFTQHYPGAMFGLGSGKNQPELHNPDYDFPDELTTKGIAMFYALAKIILK